MDDNQLSENSYTDAQAAIKYLDFLHSKNGQIQQTILGEEILKLISPGETVLDAGCGPGWLAEKLKTKTDKIYGCDLSGLFIKFAQTHHKGIDFKVADLTQCLPYPTRFFDKIIFNMSLIDTPDLTKIFPLITAVIKGNAKIIITIPNPELTYPAAVWHRSLADVILMKKPKLVKKAPPQSGEKITREFGRNKLISSYYHMLNDYISAAASAGFKLSQKHGIRSAADSRKFDLTYQLHRYPLIILLEFTKIP